MNDKADRPSKTQLKREMLRLQAMGEQLIDLPDNELATIGIPERLHEAIREARRTRKRGALHRQKQYIGRVMREIDASAIDEYLAQREERARANNARFHKAEQWRDRLIDDGDPALAELLEICPNADRQHLRQLIRQARSERQREVAPAAARKLFRYVADLLE
ncbi:MAG: DUF615 domain-containing protein [Gammaproteobacteria bacterium]|nr:DUF615 domain-containing protein [Gammaproteobacteria bacterium]